MCRGVRSDTGCLQGWRLAPFLAFGKDEHFKALGGGETPLLLFKPQEWRGEPPRCSGSKIPFSNYSCPSVDDMAARLGGYKPGSSSAIYLTSDGGGHLDTLYRLVAALPEHVQVVSANQLNAMAMAGAMAQAEAREAVAA